MTSINYYCSISFEGSLSKFVQIIKDKLDIHEIKEISDSLVYVKSPIETEDEFTFFDKFVKEEGINKAIV
jgi:hypothetical protein